METDIGLNMSGGHANTLPGMTTCFRIRYHFTLPAGPGETVAPLQSA